MVEHQYEHQCDFLKLQPKQMLYHNVDIDAGVFHCGKYDVDPSAITLQILYRIDSICIDACLNGISYVFFDRTVQQMTEDTLYIWMAWKKE